MRSIVVFLALLTVFVLASPAKAKSSGSYYEHTELDYTINADRSLTAQLSFTFVNTSWSWISSVDWPIYTDNVWGVEAEDDVGSLATELRGEGKDTKVRVKFRGRGLPPRSKLTINCDSSRAGWLKAARFSIKQRLGD
jgi:hypothetical protein